MCMYIYSTNTLRNIHLLTTSRMCPRLAFTALPLCSPLPSTYDLESSNLISAHTSPNLLLLSPRLVLLPLRIEYFNIRAYMFIHGHVNIHLCKQQHT